MNINIDTFNDWALAGKDINMQKGHLQSVEKMIELIYENTKIFDKPFKFLDIGCGNGWVVREISKFKNCKVAEGIDGAKEMINKAELVDNHNSYYLADIEKWSPNKKYDIIFSMEVFYYFKYPDKILKNLYNYLNSNGIIIIGIDHYKENKPSLNWDEEYNINTNTLSIEQWKKCLENSGLNNIMDCQFGEKDEWLGTLILLGNKK